MERCNERSSDSRAALDQIRRAIEQRVGQQLKRHRAINPDEDPRKIIDLQMSDERKRMRETLQRIEAYDAVADFDDWLLYLAKQLKERRRWN